jgi:hypothetical protein
MVITVHMADQAHGRTHQQWARRSRCQWEPKMTAAFKSTVRKVSLALALVASFSALASRASFAFSAEAQQMCSGDAFRLCSSEIPNIPKITACMIRQRANLSSGCRTVLDRDLAAPGRKVAVQ